MLALAAASLANAQSIIEEADSLLLSREQLERLRSQKTEDATDRAQEVARDQVAAIKEILSPLQFSLAPYVVQYLSTVKGRIMVRYYMY